MTEEKPTAIGAHVYAGGFTVGVSKHFDVLAHLEHKAYGAEAVRLNFPGMPIIDGGPSRWPDPHSYKRRPRFFYANPPCALWSKASHGRKLHWSDDPRLDFHKEIINYGFECQPDVIAVESVPDMFTAGRSHVDALAAQAQDEGYSTTILLHDAQRLGVAQMRPRMFAVFHKIAIPWEEIDLTAPVLTVRDVLKGVNRRAPSYDTTIKHPHVRKLVANCKPGEQLKHAFDRLFPNATKGRPSFMARRMGLDRPSHVIIHGNVYHPTELRFLSQAELAAICSYPQDYKWPAEDVLKVSGYMSRGVMPKVGEWLARQVRAGIDRNQRLNAITYSVRDVRKEPAVDYEITDVEPERRTYDMAPRAQAPAAPAKSVPLRGDGEGSGAYTRRLLSHGYDARSTLAAVHDQFPGSKATLSDIAWNRAKLAREVQTGEPTAPPSPTRKVGRPPRAAAAPERPPIVPRAELPWNDDNGGDDDMRDDDVRDDDVRDDDMRDERATVAPPPPPPPPPPPLLSPIRDAIQDRDLPETAVGRAVIKALNAAGYVITIAPRYDEGE